MVLGFTGTRKGMRPRQLKAVRQLLYHASTVHLGDCVGADAEAHEGAVAHGVRTVGHPPVNGAWRAFLSYEEERAPKDYLVRNHDIVDEGKDGLVAAPSGGVEEARSGTWATVRYARKVGRCIWIVLPDGKVKRELARGA